MKRSGKHVKIRSESGEGAIDLPCEPNNPDPRSPEASAAAPRGDGQLVLVVEDEELVRGLVVKGLGGLGYRTVEAADGDAALDMLRATPDVALVLTDVVLSGGVTGTELARRARSRRPGLPVLLMSGYAQSAVTRNGGLEQGTSLLQKPFTHRDLAEAVSAALDGGGALRPNTRNPS